jgi:hypothetical protein
MSEYCKYDVTLNYAPPIAELTEYTSALTDLRERVLPQDYHRRLDDRQV